MSIYKSRQNDIHIPYFNINNLITFEDLNAINKKTPPNQENTKPNNRKNTIQEKSQQKIICTC